VKIFLFQFVNSYASFFYLAFIAKYFGDCPQNGCMGVLGINLGIIYGTRLAASYSCELLLPYFDFLLRYGQSMYSAGADMMSSISRPEKEHLLDEVSFIHNSDVSLYLF
jgi:hypothetical protein